MEERDISALTIDMILRGLNSCFQSKVSLSFSLIFISIVYLFLFSLPCKGGRESWVNLRIGQSSQWLWITSSTLIVFFRRTSEYHFGSNKQKRHLLMLKIDGLFFLFSEGFEFLLRPFACDWSVTLTVWFDSFDWERSGHVEVVCTFGFPIFYFRFFFFIGNWCFFPLSLTGRSWIFLFIFGGKRCESALLLWLRHAISEAIRKGESHSSLCNEWSYESEHWIECRPNQFVSVARD